MIPATVWTDGSCVFGSAERYATGRGAGGYAAVVERGSYGWVRRGGVPDTTSSAMELRAIVEGLRSLPNAVPTVVVTDCWLAPAIQSKRRDGLSVRHAERRGWAALVEQLDRVDVVFRLVEKREVVPQHQRAHSFAHAEAKAMLARLTTDSASRLA